MVYVGSCGQPIEDREEAHDYFDSHRVCFGGVGPKLLLQGPDRHIDAGWQFAGAGMGVLAIKYTVPRALQTRPLQSFVAKVVLCVRRQDGWDTASSLVQTEDDVGFTRKGDRIELKGHPEQGMKHGLHSIDTEPLTSLFENVSIVLFGSS